ncbi:MAG: 5'-methylthioadenosine/S-adenosylhomocysteine nucleosidase [Epsilonproteobacteria bacterium]|nr:5'-methylthioadenosine/S-adenosylhomocysteine nucleosidase [Campylobacterota bacterium]
MLNIITALKTEANEIIKYFKLKHQNGIYQNEKINLIITGSGKIKCAINTALLLQKYPHKSINFGIAGSNKYEVGNGFFIEKIVDEDSSFEYYPDFFKQPSGTVHTVSKIGNYFELVDMESSGFFEAAYKFLSVEEIILYKIVSDTPSKKPKNIQELIKKHLHIIEELLETNLTQTDDIKLNSPHLTQSMQNELKNLLIFAKLKKINITIPQFQSKKEAKEFIRKLNDMLR